jgi:hypothetical protein
MFPVVLFGVAFNMNEIKMALGRDGETEPVRESVQSGGREIGWVNDGLKWCVDHSSAPLKPVSEVISRGYSQYDDLVETETVAFGGFWQCASSHGRAQTFAGLQSRAVHDHRSLADVEMMAKEKPGHCWPGCVTPKNRTYKTSRLIGAVCDGRLTPQWAD